MESPAPLRKIIHIDMDAFYASVEQRDNPEYRGKAIVVGGGPEGRGGVVATASYEARKYGIRSAMPSKQAQQLCPHVLFIKPRFDAYKEVSRRLREIFGRYTDQIEPLSLDEAYLDVTTDKMGIGSAMEIAAQIKQAIRDELQLTASAGVSTSKFVAKIASDMNKPDGLTFIGPSSIESFMETLPVEKFYGVGRVTAQKMKGMGLHTGSDLKALSESDMIRHFGKPGKFYYQIVRGIDHRQVQSSRQTKSLGAEDTFPYDLRSIGDMKEELARIAMIVHERLQKKNLCGRTVTLKIRFHDFRLITRSQSFQMAVSDLETIITSANKLLAGVDMEDKRVRLLGISLSGFHDPQAAPPEKRPGQLTLF